MRRSRLYLLSALGNLAASGWWVLLALVLLKAIGPIGLVFYGLAGISFYGASVALARSVEELQDERRKRRTDDRQE